MNKKGLNGDLITAECTLLHFCGHDNPAHNRYHFVEVIDVDGSILLELRNKHHITQIQLAKALGLHPKSIKNWERGISDPSAENLCSIADYFHVTVDYLLGRHTDEVISISGLPEKEQKKLIAMFQAYMDVYFETK